MQKNLKSLSVLLILVILKVVTPNHALDPWNLLNLNKIISMVLALAFIQALGSGLAQYLGTKMGAILTGFFGGIISSTATTASVAKNSNHKRANNAVEVLTIISAIAAMLIQSLALVTTGLGEVHYNLLMVFIIPLFGTVLLIYAQYKTLPEKKEESQDTNFKILPIIKLTIFIVVIIAASKIIQNYFGQNGLYFVTFLISLFEIHGSLIANVQLHEINAISISELQFLLALSVLASFVSKIFLIWTIGSPTLKPIASKYMLVLLTSTALSWCLQFILF